MKEINNILKYIDIFGTKYHFYFNKKPRYYSILGGILSLITFIICLGIFILASSKRINPFIITTVLFSSKNIFEKDKIFIPWKIVNDNNIFINHPNIIITTKDDNNNIKLINYKLCNDTSMVNITKSIKDDTFLFPSLEELYCLDLGEIFNNDNSISYNIIFNLYSTYQINYNLKNNSFIMDFFYPIIKFSPDDFLQPLLNIYQKHSVNLNNNEIKNEKIILGETSIFDKYGFFGTKNKFSSLWGTNSFHSEKIIISVNKNELIPIYSLNISLDLQKIHYKRLYSNIFTIFIDIFPICYILFKFIKYILKAFILARSNANLAELLFEKVVDKENKLDIYKYKMKFKSLGEHNSKNSIKHNRVNKKISNIQITKNDNIIMHNIDNTEKKDDKEDINDFYKIKNIERKSQTDIPIIKLSKACRKKSRRSVDYGIISNINSQNNNNLFLINQNILINKNSKENSIQMDCSKYSIIQDDKIFPAFSHKFSRIKTVKLFPYKYYFFSSFLKNFDISNCQCLFSLKYKKVFTFINQLLDINSYILLKKEFEIMKHIYCNKEDLELIENNKKINVNSTKFAREIKDCIDNNKFYIFYRRAK